MISLNDPIDTTTSQGRMIFGIFASLAEFERELIRERTSAGLVSARARGRNGGRPKGMSQDALEKVTIAEALKLDVEQYSDAYQFERATRLGVSEYCVWYALKCLGVTYKKNPSASKGNPRKTLCFLR